MSSPLVCGRVDRPGLTRHIPCRCQTFAMMSTRSAVHEVVYLYLYGVPSWTNIYDLLCNLSMLIQCNPGDWEQCQPRSESISILTTLEGLRSHSAAGSPSALIRESASASEMYDGKLDYSCVDVKICCSLLEKIRQDRTAHNDFGRKYRDENTTIG